ncbi:MAG TPA: Uma2 family endonuclease [Kofleriaceae bacterium]|nr:Uma2 family endonuclease [Kofleriaceae bacterium]
MADPARRPKSFRELYAEIEALPENLTGEILEEGVLRTMSRPGRRHRRAARGCLDALSGVDANLRGTGWWIEIEAEIVFPGERLVVPDLAGWRVDRVPDLPDENPLTVLPDWCCEVLSPSTARDDERLKLPMFARAHIEWTWIVDPILRLIRVYQSVNGLPTLVTTAQEDDRRVIPPFDHEIALAGWWLPDPAPEPR